jgi:hypothetical protein
MGHRVVEASVIPVAGFALAARDADRIRPQFPKVALLTPLADFRNQVAHGPANWRSARSSASSGKPTTFE